MSLNGCRAFVEAHESDGRVVLVLTTTQEMVRARLANIFAVAQGRAAPSRGDPLGYACLGNSCMSSESGLPISGGLGTGGGIAGAIP